MFTGGDFFGRSINVEGKKWKKDFEVKKRGEPKGKTKSRTGGESSAQWGVKARLIYEERCIHRGIERYLFLSFYEF